jgi:P-type conjugative transfer protein TrbG
MKKRLSIILGAAMLMPVFTLAHADATADKYFSKEKAKLSKQDNAALAIAQRWQANNMQPFAGRNGAVQFVYGAQDPTVVCAVLQICDVALQPGEQVNSIQLGDKARWSVDPAVSGEGASQVLHLIIKPFDVGLSTSLVVATDRRTYHLRLKSTRNQFMPTVSFSYPEDALAKWTLLEHHEQAEHERKIIPQSGEYLGNLSFAYDVTGNAPWKPVRVYNDGRKTVIQMPKSMEQSDAPTLLVERDGDDKTEMVNYRLQGDRFIVDSVFDKAILISGVGDNQEKITIARSK